MSEEVVLELTTKCKEKAVKIDGQVYYVRELVGTDRDQFLNGMNNKMKVGSDGKLQQIRDYSGLHASLIHLSLYAKDGQKVDVKTIQGWPASTQAALFKLASELSGLNKDAEEEAKND